MFQARFFKLHSCLLVNFPSAVWMTAFASNSRNILFARASTSRAAIFRIIGYPTATIRVFAFIVSICHLSNSFQVFSILENEQM
jgi:hypothetical protein